MGDPAKPLCFFHLPPPPRYASNFSTPNWTGLKRILSESLSYYPLCTATPTYVRTGLPSQVSFAFSFLNNILALPSKFGSTLGTASRVDAGNSVSRLLGTVSSSQKGRLPRRSIIKISYAKVHVGTREVVRRVASMESAMLANIQLTLQLQLRSAKYAIVMTCPNSSRSALDAI